MSFGFSTVSAPGLQVYDCTITHKPPTEIIYSPPILLPTSKPSTPQITIVVSNDILPTFSAGVPQLIKYQLDLYFYMKNNSPTAYEEIHISITVNDSEAMTCDLYDVGPNTYWTISAFLGNVGLNDVVKIYMWCLRGYIDLRYSAYQAIVGKMSHFIDKSVVHGYIYYGDGSENNLSAVVDGYKPVVVREHKLYFVYTPDEQWILAAEGLEYQCFTAVTALGRFQYVIGCRIGTFYPNEWYYSYSSTPGVRYEKQCGLKIVHLVAG